MIQASRILFYFFLALLFTVEGLGIKAGHEIVYYIVLCAPFFLFFLDYINKVEYKIVPKPVIFLGSFLIFSFASVNTSVNWDLSIRTVFLSIALFCIFIYSLTHASSLKRTLPSFLLVVSSLYSLYTIALQLFITKLPAVLHPDNGYQFVSSLYGTHNHLGDILVLSIVYCIYRSITDKNRLYLLLTAFFIPSFLLSFSRSAYLSCILTIIVLEIITLKQKKIAISSRAITVLIFLIATSVLLFISSVYESSKLPFFGTIHQALSSSGLVHEKTFISNRDEYLSEALQAMWTHPFFGFGPGTFKYVSQKFSHIPYHWTYTSHSFFFDLAAGTGIVPALFLFIFIAFGLSKIRSGSFFLIFLAMVITMQTDYVYEIYAYLVLFFVIAAILFENNAIPAPLARPSVFFLSALLLVGSQLIIISTFLQFQKPTMSLQLYPFNKEAYESLIANNNATKNQLKAYERYFSGDYQSLLTLATYYLKMDDSKKALFYYEKAYETYPLHQFDTVKSIYSLKKQIESEDRALEFVNNHFSRFKNVRHTYAIPDAIKDEMAEFCKDEHAECPTNLWMQ